MCGEISISRKQLERVLAAPKIQHAHDLRQDDLFELLTWLTTMVQTLVTLAPVVEAQERAAINIKTHFDALRVEVNAYPERVGPPPPAVPVFWQLQMEEWMKLMISSRQPGNPGRPQANALKLLCAYYRFAFGREPSATDKPTREFITQWFAEFGAEMQSATESVTPGDKRKLKGKVWMPPQEEALRKALPQYLNNSEVISQLCSAYDAIVSFRQIKETIEQFKA